MVMTFLISFSWLSLLINRKVYASVYHTVESSKILVPGLERVGWDAVVCKRRLPVNVELEFVWVSCDQNV